MYSIVICYRDREEHLKTLVPLLRTHFANEDYEIIVSEQNDDQALRRGCLRNEGVKKAKGDIIILHDVDYVPTNDAMYWPTDASNTDVFRPIRLVDFINMDGTPRADDDTPAGYRSFKNGIDSNFFGGVVCLTRDAFDKVNGFNPLYEGWGLEDADFRERLRSANLRITDGEGLFRALPHTDSFRNDELFKRNTELFAKWEEYKTFGSSNSYAATNLNQDKATTYNVDTWVESTTWMVTSPGAEALFSIDELSKFYEDVPGKHTAIWSAFEQLVNQTTYLQQHRDWVTGNDWGYGEKQFHWMWNLLIREAPKHFKMLEIGVFKGQTISLISLLNKQYRKEGQIFGLTPLTKSGDQYATHPDIDYEAAISTIYGTFGLDAEDLTIFHGLSTDSLLIEQAEAVGPYDMIYVDGCHDYAVVVSDIEHSIRMLKSGGYLAIDDASSNLQIPDGMIRMNWRGLPDVSRAVTDTLENNPQFVHLFAIGHNRVFRKV